MEPVNPDIIKAQINSLDEHLLFESSGYRAYLISASDAPDVVLELCRLREETFRLVGEGTGNEIDTDIFDSYYKHMFLWNISNEELVGAYRLGYGSEITKNHGGVNGFYTSTLIDYGENACDMLSHCVELGRSFIIKKYQKEILPLKFLLAGLAISVTKDENTDCVIGTVSISAKMPERYMSMIAGLLSARYGLEEKICSPRNPLKYSLTLCDEFRINNMLNNIDDLDRFIFEQSKGEHRIPVLVKKYFNCGARVACFNVDEHFSNCTDALIVLKLSDFPRNTLNSLLRMLTEENKNKIFEQFYHVPHSI